MNFGIVVIGRNEAANLARVLATLPDGVPVVYVDSASGDDSVAIANRAGVAVLCLAHPPRMTAARGRNAGFAWLVERHPGLDAIQMIDGDCEMMPGWLDAASSTLEKHGRIAAVCGRLRERNAGTTLYARLCDREWRVAPGDVQFCGGNAAFRVSAFAASGGFDPALAAGEEPELCHRLRQSGCRIVAIDVPMALHDAEIVRFTQWWARTRRSGEAFASLALLYGLSADRTWLRQLLSIVAWTGLIPLALVMSLIFENTWIVIFAVLSIAMQIAKIANREVLLGLPPSTALEVAGMTMLGKLAQVAGIVRHLARPR